ncbi:MAG: hemerythrin domain-containing protein [Acidobacteriota bacterium]|jgi:hypothetical protein
MIETRTSFESIVAQHRELEGLIGELREFLEATRPEAGQKGYHTWASDLSGKLNALHDKLFRHFREEEEGGFLDQLARDNPAAVHTLETMRVEHSRMLESLRDLIRATLDYSVGEAENSPPLRRFTMSILDQLARHEARETELLQTTYSEDLGLGD